MVGQEFEIGGGQSGQQIIGQRTRRLSVQDGILPGRSGPLSAGVNMAFRDDASTVCFVALSEVQADVCAVPVRSRRPEIYSVGSSSGRYFLTTTLQLDACAGDHDPCLSYLSQHARCGNVPLRKPLCFQFAEFPIVLFDDRCWPSCVSRQTRH
jgi:hypothetical protein